MDYHLNHVLRALANFAELTPEERAAAARESSVLRTSDDAGAAAAWNALAALTPAQLAAAQPLVTGLLEQLSQRARQPGKTAPQVPHSPEIRNAITKLYNELRDSPRGRWAILSSLAASGSATDLALFAELLASAPPPDAPQLAVAFGALFQRSEIAVAALFPRLLDALSHKHLAGPILDLANYLTREGKLPEHPAREHADELVSLLGALVQRLAKIEEAPDGEGRDAEQVGAIIHESLPLAVSLCDALALLENKSAIGKLNQALELRHRRLRTEAAAALARLGEKSGAAALVELAAEPVARLRVLKYAEELGISDRIADVYRTPAAQAESRLALWLAQPSQFGIPPTSLELFDEREMYWPSFNDPVECFLFRFQYDLGGGLYANIGISGPLEHAMSGDLNDLPPDDIYAAFAGWHVQHEELREFDVSLLNETERVDVARLERRLRDAGYDAIAPHTLALFFGERVLIAQAVFDGRAGYAIVTSGGEIAWFARIATARPLSAQEVYCIFKGRRLLRTFNP
jgi:hypothetical protein